MLRKMSIRKIIISSLIFGLFHIVYFLSSFDPYDLIIIYYTTLKALELTPEPFDDEFSCKAEKNNAHDYFPALYSLYPHPRQRHRSGQYFHAKG